MLDLQAIFGDEEPVVLAPRTEADDPTINPADATVDRPPDRPLLLGPRCDRCGSDQFNDVPIHEGRSLRRDCAHCGRFIDFPKWYDVERPGDAGRVESMRAEDDSQL